MKVILLCFGLLVMGSNYAYAEAGVWQPAGNFSQVNVACMRTYTCGPASDILYDARHRIVATKPALVLGVCSSGQGPIDSCNICLTSGPSQPCEWHLE